MKVAFPATTHQERVLLLWFGVCVAGKLAADIERKVNMIMESTDDPFARLASFVENDTLRTALEAVNMGKYGTICRATEDIVALLRRGDIDLETCSVDELTAIRGVGPKTAHFFLMYSRDDYKGAVLDTHILKWLARRHSGIPRQTPQNGRYQELLDLFLAEAAKWGYRPAELDAEIWRTERDKKPMMFWGEVFPRDPDEAGESEYRTLVETCQDGLMSMGWRPECGMAVDADYYPPTAKLEHSDVEMLEGMLVEFLNGASDALNRLRRRRRTNGLRAAQDAAGGPSAA